jgi:phage recombination protein Bet
MTDTITGILTDYALMDEGVNAGFYAAQIDDKPYVVLHHVDAFLLRLAKGERVEANLNKDGQISKIQRAKRTAAAPTDGTRTKEQIAHAQAAYNAAADAEAEKRRKAGFVPPVESTAENVAKDNAQGDARIAENAEYLKTLAALGKTEDCTSPLTPSAVVPIQTFKPVPVEPMTFDNDQVALIKATVARGCTDTEFRLLMYLAAQYKLDPIRRQIWAVKYGTAPAAIFTGRDGFLEIAHRSGVFDGMESGTREDEKGNIVGFCTVYRKDMSHPFKIEVHLSEYDTKKSNWLKMPRVMIQKVAESSCLRRAFSVSGLYCPGEMPDQPGGA